MTIFAVALSSVKFESSVMSCHEMPFLLFRMFGPHKCGDITGAKA
jgi:hypothetical protein